MINPFVMRKYAALCTSALLTLVLFYVATVMWHIYYGVAFMLCGLVLSIVLGNKLLENPFQKILEGKGILTLDINSTGVIQPFIMSVQHPYVRGKHRGEEVEDVFDRNATFQIAEPKEAGTAEKSQNGLTIHLSEEEYHGARFALYHFPVLIYNSQIKSMLTKDMMSDQEKSLFVQHAVMYVSRKMEELTHYMRDFGRSVVELTRPQGNLLQNKWAMIGVVIFVIFIVILVVMFAPAIIGTLKSSLGSASNAASSATESGQAVSNG